MPTRVNYNIVCKKLDDEFGIAPDDRVALKRWIVDLVTEETENEAARWRDEVIRARKGSDMSAHEVGQNKAKIAGFERLIVELKEIRVLRECCAGCGTFIDGERKCGCSTGSGWRIDRDKIKV